MEQELIRQENEKKLIEQRLREKLRKQQADEEQKVALTPNGKQTE